MSSSAPHHSRAGLSVKGSARRDVARALPEETPIAVVLNGTTQAVMMATPDDIEDFAVGFALTEGFVTDLSEIDEIEVTPAGDGIEARLWLAPHRAEEVKTRNRARLGPVGCGMCGLDSIEAAMRPLPVIASDLVLTAEEVGTATDALREHQPLHDRTRAVHAAGFLVPGRGIVLAREDVGRHNALDKLIGAMLRAGIGPAQGAIVLTSRVSLEMVQKTVIAGSPILIAVSAPTTRALDQAEAAGLTVAAFARAGSFDLYCHPQRIADGDAHVA